MIWEWIEKSLSPPGIRQVHRRTLYRIIGRIGDQIVEDIRKTKREFISGLATQLEAHGTATGIYRLPYEEKETHRSRLMRATLVLQETGRRKGLETFLSQYVPDRWKIIDPQYDAFLVGVSRIGIGIVGRTPAVVVLIRELTTEEQSDVKQFLEWSLGADIEFLILSR